MNKRLSKRKNQAISLLLAFAMVLSVYSFLPMGASAAGDETYSEETYYPVYEMMLDAGYNFYTYIQFYNHWPKYAPEYKALLDKAVESGTMEDAIAAAEFAESLAKGTHPGLEEDRKEEAEYKKQLEYERLAAMYDPTKIDTSGVGFADVKPGAWYYEAVTTMAATGILKGKTPELFKPNDKITVGEWCTIVWRLVGSELYAPEDVKYIGYPHWASSAVGECKFYDYTSMSISRDGSSENSLANRGEVATAIVKIVETAYGKEDDDSIFKCSSLGTVMGLAHKEQDGLANYLLGRQAKNGAKTWTGDMIPDWATVEKNVEPNVIVGIVDWHSTHRWDPDSIVRAYNYGILEGKDASGTCRPEMSITRAEACQMLYNALIFEPRPVLVRGGGSISG